ncbi:MAG: hypothetical protein RQM92_09265 [Candidatus Syntrophopropionicum ammoniitolerans]
MGLTPSWFMGRITLPRRGAEQIPDEVVEVHLIEKGPTAHREQKAANKVAKLSRQHLLNLKKDLRPCRRKPGSSPHE